MSTVDSSAGAAPPESAAVAMLPLLVRWLREVAAPAARVGHDGAGADGLLAQADLLAALLDEHARLRQQRVAPTRVSDPVVRVPDPHSDPTDLAAAVAWLHHRTDPMVCNIGTATQQRLGTVLAEYERRGSELAEAREEADEARRVIRQLRRRAEQNTATLVTLTARTVKDAEQLRAALDVADLSDPDLDAQIDIEYLIDEARSIRVDRDRLRQQRAAALALHVEEHGVCGACLQADEEPAPWPCPTARALGVDS